MRLFKTFLVFVLMLTLISCGFHLRGQIQLPPQLHKFYVDGAQPYSPIISAIQKELRFSGITVVDSAKKAPITLYVLSETLTHTETTVSTSNSMKSYTVTYTVSFALKNSNGKTIAGPFSVSSNQTITTLANEVLENSNKLPRAKRELTQDVVVKMFYILGAKNTKDKLFEALNIHEAKHENS